MLNIFKEEYFIKFENYVEKDVLTEEELNNGELPDTNVYIIDVCNAIKKQFTFLIFDRLNESNSFNMQEDAFKTFYQCF